MNAAAAYPHEIPILPEGELATDEVEPDGIRTYSLTAHALAEIDRHKWIESQKVGHDLGRISCEQWLQLYWRSWVRVKLLEHLYGWRRWSAFPPEQFGIFLRTTLEHIVPAQVLARVSGILGTGGENLDVIDWAVDNGEDLNAIFWLLSTIDINAVRHRLLTDHMRIFLP